MRILIVDDERKVASFLARGLGEEGHTVAMAADGPTALSLANEQAFDAVVLDVMLPGLDGLGVCKVLRERSPGLGILMLSARGEASDRIKGLSAGADDYLVKPFAFEELLLRLGALERRMAPAALAAGALRLDPVKLTLHGRTGEVAVTPREAALLATFLAHPGEVLSREQLAAEAWDTPFETRTNHVDVYVNYVRKKLSAVGHPHLLETLRGEGYRLGADK